MFAFIKKSNIETFEILQIAFREFFLSPFWDILREIRISKVNTNI